MKVRIKSGKTQFINEKLHHGGDILELRSKYHSITGDEISAKQQFNPKTMEKIEVEKIEKEVIKSEVKEPTKLKIKKK